METAENRKIIIRKTKTDPYWARCVY